MVKSRKITIFGVIFLLMLVVTVMFTTTACEDLGLGGSSDPTDTEENGFYSTPEEVELAVYRHLLEQAESSEAKLYLADFYSYSYNWSSQSEYLRDGSETWLVSVDMTAETDWSHKSYWQRAGWFVLKDGSVIPANIFQLNALRIEADLAELSNKTTSEED